jgi:hypothetical protein
MKQIVLSIFVLLVSFHANAQDVTPVPDTNTKAEFSGTEIAPGYEDFENRDLTPEDVKEMEERRDDRNIVSPGMRDDMGLQGN